MLRRAEWFCANNFAVKVVTTNNPKVVTEFFENAMNRHYRGGYPLLYRALNLSGNKNLPGRYSTNSSSNNNSNTNVIRGKSKDGKYTELSQIKAQILYDASLTTLV